MAGGTEPSVVRHSAGLHLFLWLAFPLLGGVIGWVLSQVPRWSQDLAWIPFRGPLELLDQLSGRTTTGVLIDLGVILGGVVALTAYDDIVRIDVARDVVRFTRAGEAVEIPAADVAGAFTDGKFIVIVDSAGRELVPEKTDHTASRNGGSRGCRDSTNVPMPC